LVGWVGFLLRVDLRQQEAECHLNTIPGLDTMRPLSLIQARELCLQHSLQYDETQWVNCTRYDYITPGTNLP
jgi:hypothetical protein